MCTFFKLYPYLKMPSKSRKKIKGQLRKSKNVKKTGVVKASDIQGSWVPAPFNNVIVCSHGQPTNVPDVCSRFINSFFKSFFRGNYERSRSSEVNLGTLIDATQTPLSTACVEFPEAINIDTNLEIVKKNIICNGTTYLLGQYLGPPYMSLVCVVALEFIDTYTPSSPIHAGNFDGRDAKKYLRVMDIINGCQHSLVKYFMNQIPCKCLGEKYSQLRSTTPKMAACVGCKQRKERKRMYICTGCERVQYCSTACQSADVPNHKEFCKEFQVFDNANKEYMDVVEKLYN